MANFVLNRNCSGESLIVIASEKRFHRVRSGNPKSKPKTLKQDEQGFFRQLAACAANDRRLRSNRRCSRTIVTTTSTNFK
jgi:hypothetical protein